jgi:hypothetical protein
MDSARDEPHLGQLFGQQPLAFIIRLEDCGIVSAMVHAYTQERLRMSDRRVIPRFQQRSLRKRLSGD